MNTLRNAIQDVIDELDVVVPRALEANSSLSADFAPIRTALVALRDEPPADR